ncbi:MAG: HEAT repeat domain-containing protein [bacterium]|nr:HEAT repeat domain-containing protein [bacterium]
MDKGWEDIKEGDTVWLTAVSIDMVGSTNLYEEGGDREAERRKNFFRQAAERSLGEKRCEWHGEGTTFFFLNEEEAFRRAINFIGQIRTGIDVELSARISIASGFTQFKEELGKMDAYFISLAGHINPACPENSILITEDFYDNLPDELKEKFGLCGTTRRDEIITFIYPPEKRRKKDPEKFLPDKEDPAPALRQYLDAIKGQCKTLLFAGIPQSSKIPLLELTESFFPLKVRKRERGFRIAVPRDLRIEERMESYSESPPYPFTDIFKKETQIIILGDPGTGKTTLLRWLCLIYSQGTKAIFEKELGEKRLFPLIIPISSLYIQRNKEGFINPVDAITNYIADLGVRLPTDYIEKMLNNGECLVLLDGIDEIPEKKDRINIAKYTEGFIRRFERNKFIITSRIVGYEEIKVGSEEYTLTELGNDEIPRFAYNWFLAFERTVQGKTPLAEKEAEKRNRAIVEALEENPNIKRLAKNPFLLTHICLIQVQDQTLPKYRVDLYRLMCESLFSTWVKARSLGDVLTTPIDYREGEKVLAPLALWMHREIPGGLVEGDRIKKEIVRIMIEERDVPKNEAREATTRFFEYLADQTQLLVNRGGDKWGFRHRTFEEFLSARAMIMKEEYPAYLEKYSHDIQWEEVFLLLAGWIGIIDSREKEVTNIVENLLSKEDELENILHKNLLLAGKIVAEYVGVKKSLADKIINEIVSLRLNTDYYTLCSEATKVLKKGKELSVPILTAVLNDKGEKVEVRKGAAFALGKIGEKASIPILTAVLNDKGEKVEVRRGAAFALGKIGEKASGPILTAILKDKGEDKRVRQGAVLVLGNIGEEASGPILTAILKDKGEDRDVRTGAAFALGEIGEKASIPILTSILKDKGEDGWVRRWAAASALGEIGEKSSIPILTAILKDKGEDKRVRQGAVLVLGNIGEEASGPILTAILKDKGEDRDVRTGAAFALGEIGEKALSPILTAILKDKEEEVEVRREAASALGKIGKADEEVIDILREVISKQEKGLWIPVLLSATKLGLPIKGLQETIIEELNKPSLDPSDKNPLFDSLWQITS